MALGQQRSPGYVLVTFALWARRAGYSVGEMHGFTSVNARAHARGSWHFDREPDGFGKACDINWPGGGAAEREQLIHAGHVAADLGLGHIYARDGFDGPANTHRTHLHVDVGPFATWGKGSYVPRGGGDHRTIGIQQAVNADADGVWGENTHWRVETVALASRHHGGKFPWGIEHAQRVLGVADDGDWGPKSEAAHDRAVAAIQRALGVGDDGVWGGQTQGAYERVRDIRWRR